MVISETQMQYLIEEEEKKLYDRNLNSLTRCNIAYNLLSLKAQNTNSDTYKIQKIFHSNYISSLKEADFGYDIFNYEKIERALNMLDYDQKITMIDYIISELSNQFPEQDKKWFINRKHIAYINKTINKKEISNLPKAILLLVGLNTRNLIITLFIFFIITFSILLPAPNGITPYWQFNPVNYTDNNITNTIINTLAIFSGVDEGIKIQPLNSTSAVLMILGKVFYVIVIINFLYVKITDRITKY